MCVKMSYYNHLLNCQKHVLYDELKRQLVGSLVSSHLTYVLCVWGPYLTQQRQRLQRLQNRAFLFCTGSRKFGSVWWYCMRWLSISELIQYQLCVRRTVNSIPSRVIVFLLILTFNLVIFIYIRRGTFWWNLLPTTVDVSAQQSFSRTFCSTLQYNNFLIL